MVCVAQVIKRICLSGKVVLLLAYFTSPLQMGISEHSSHGSRSFTDAFREVSRKISRRSLRSEVAESELRNTCGGATCDNDVFVTEHADKEDVKTEEEATGDSKV